MASKAKYSVGTKLKHTTKKAWGVVEEVFYDGAEWRYYVRHSGFIWSVAERFLQAK